jgi:NAD(P)-dependent dehydrogenase (short-subunit alcohol dehydrogenase family)
MTTVGIATGAGRGMGFACAKRLTDMVDALLLVDLDGEGLSSAEKELSGSGRAAVEPVLLDITDAEGLQRLASRVSELGTFRALAHAAGISPTMADWKRIFTVDLVGTAMITEALRPLASAGTAMVYFASMAGWLAFAEGDPDNVAVLDNPLEPGFLDRMREALGPSVEDPGMAYSWAKRGVQRFTQREAVRLGPIGARACCVSPGIIDTPQGRQEAQTHLIMKEMVEKTPLSREGRAEEVAAAVAFLLSDEASFVNGIDLLVDGGIVASLRTS